MEGKVTNAGKMCSIDESLDDRGLQ